MVLSCAIWKNIPILVIKSYQMTLVRVLEGKAGCHSSRDVKQPSHAHTVYTSSQNRHFWFLHHFYVMQESI